MSVSSRPNGLLEREDHFAEVSAEMTSHLMTSPTRYSQLTYISRVNKLKPRSRDHHYFYLFIIFEIKGSNM